MKFIKSYLYVAIISVLVVLISLFALKGDSMSFSNNSNYLQNYITSPFESSHSSSRYALTKSIAESGSIFLDSSLAALSSPDLTKVGEKYISIFTPGVSFLSLPFYYLGRAINYPQLTTFLSTILYSVFNIFLLYKLCLKMGSTTHSAVLAALIYGFGTNALAYSGTLAQHSLSVTYGLSLLLLSTSKITISRSIMFGLIYGLAILSDIPNALLYMPQFIYYFYRHFRVVSINNTSNLFMQVKLTILGLLISLLIPLIIFGYYNQLATGSFYKLGQRLGRAIYPPNSISQLHITPNNKLATKEKFKQFDTERQIRGYYTLLFSDTRGIFYYSPVLVIGLLGIANLWIKRKYRAIHILALTTIGINIVLYATFNDPWGGWAFGARYLIPTAALLSSFISLLITNVKHKLFYALLIITLIVPSVYVSISGTLTTTVVPPDVYTESLTERVHDDYQYNLEMITEGKSSSLLYNTILNKYVNLSELHVILTITTVLIFLLQSILIIKEKHEE